jgi:hypothetical protein
VFVQDRSLGEGGKERLAGTGTVSRDANAWRGERTHHYGALPAVGGVDREGWFAIKDELLDKGETVEPERCQSAGSKELKLARA